MNKKLLALAVTSALAGVSAGVNADTANVNVYGKIYLQAETVSGHGATQAGGFSSPTHNAAGSDLVSHQEIADPNSYVGFKGEDNIGSGMKGWFQIESAVKADDPTGASTTDTSKAALWATRNSAVGLSGAFGNVFMGNWDTVYKQLGDPNSFLGISSGNFVSTSNVLSKSPISKSGSLSSFHLRQKNDIEYDSPTIAGFTVMVNYSPDEKKTLFTNAYLRDIGVKFEQGPLYIALANELHNDFFGFSTSADSGLSAFANPLPTATNGMHSKDTATRLSAMYKLPSQTNIAIDLAELKYAESGGSVGHFAEAKGRAVALVVTQQLGSFTLAANYVKADKGSCSLVGGADCTTDGLGAQQVSLGGKYDFSKRSSVYVIYSKITNKDGAQYNNVGGNIAPGVDPEALAVGIIHSF